ncbi:HTH-type transcriptional repressor GlaR [Actinomadura sp. RB99]|jgi:DNA-binding GntR family transcriptional regulator|uniref:GntR family transcriptional regulator n=1 Tax=Actinomadura sp. RB99 TaxID=2691577 RepID=UPI00168A2523|nr:FCD domain-containing protein [Actinomadura sp. RB99]MBD2892306.1 HTH-type transcriptional repressor GlaR [Actinomadura sp. RB99]
MVKRGGSGTRATEAYEQIRQDIFTGRLAPGQRLKFPALCAQYETSPGVLREAFTKLVGERLVALQPHQGYAVASLSADELADVTAARVELEALAFRLSMATGDGQWEAEVVAAHHVLGLREREASDGPRGDEWYLAHEAFHAALVSGCGNRRLIAMARELRAETELYRRWAAPLIAEHDRDPAAEHRALADAALARDLDRGATLLRDHIAFTTRMLLTRLGDGAVTAGDSPGFSAGVTGQA